MNPLQIAKKYFEVSNQSDFREISKLLNTSSTYSSQNTGLYLWVDDIIEMQKAFHESFESLNWDIIDIREEKLWIVKVNFVFKWLKKWEKVEFSAIEYIVVLDWIIQHIEIRNK